MFWLLDYDEEELFNEFRNTGSYGYNPFNKSDDDDVDPKHKTTTWKSHFLVFWPKSYSSENLACFGVAPIVSSASASAANSAVDAEDADSEVNYSSLQPAAAKSKPKKPTDFESEYAKSARSHCVLCKGKIAKDVLRMGINVAIEVNKIAL